MKRLLGGFLVFLALYSLFGCASFKDLAGRPGQEQTQPAGSNACASTAATEESALPGTAQVCRLDSAVCYLQTTTPPPAISAPDKAAPVVQVPEKSFDFGTMRGDGDFSHKFKIMNTGTSDLIIKKIIPG